MNRWSWKANKCQVCCNNNYLDP